jgi:carbohydrate diacid regulator
MQINRKLADQVVSKAQSILKREVLLADMGGLILGGGEIAPGTFVKEALAVSQTGQIQTTTYEDRPVKWWPFIYEERTIAIFGIFLESGPITPEATMLLQGLAEVIVYQYLLLDHVQSAEAVRGEFIKTLLTAATLGEANDLYRQADILQINIHVPQAVMLLEIEHFERNIRDGLRDASDEERSRHIEDTAVNVATSLQESFPHNRGNLVTYLGDNRFVLIKGISGEGQTTLNTIKFLTDQGKQVLEQAQSAWPKYVITLGIGQYYPDLGGLRKSYQDAKLALEVGMKVWKRGKYYHIKQVGMFITLANTSQDRKAELAHQILSPLLRDEQLFKTVQAFLANGLNLTDAAENLHIHRNTLIYRLDKTKKLINLDPRHFDDALQIKLGLMFYQAAD